MRKVRENILVTKGDQEFFPGDKPVWITDDQGTAYLNGVLDGQPVLYNYDTGISIAHDGGKTIADVPRLVIAVGRDTNGDGLADTLRKPFGEMIYANSISAATVEPSTCGLVRIQDLYFGCVKCDGDYSITLQVEDDITQNQFPYNRPETFPIHVKANCCQCDNCGPDEIDPVKLACEIVKKVNNVAPSSRKVPMFGRKNGKRINRIPVKAVRLYGDPTTPNVKNTKDYCIDVQKNSCGDCLEMDAIGGFTFNHPVNGATTVTFSPATFSGTTSLQAHLPRIIREINKGLDGYGSAVMTSPLMGSGKPCCQVHIQVNSCDANFALNDNAGAAITPCAETNPFVDIEVGADCKDCQGNPVGQTPFEPKAGVRFIADPMEISCMCDFPANTPRGILYRDVKVFPGTDFVCGQYMVRDVQKPKIPQNLGYEWKWREFASDVGGQGRGHNQWGYDPVGNLGLPLQGKNGVGGSRAYATESECQTMYMVYAIEHSIPNTDIGIHGRHVSPRGTTFLLIPQGDTTTQGQFDTFFNTWKDSLPLLDLDSTKDQDQIETEVDPTTGDVTQEEYPNTGQGFIQ